MLPPRKPALALDFGRVLTLDPDQSVFQPVQTRAGLEAAPFFRAYQSLRREYDRGTLDALAYWTAVLRACRPGMDGGEIASYLSDLIDADFLSWARPRSGLQRLIAEAVRRGVPTAIVSNMPGGVGDRFVKAWPWLAAVPHRFFSAEFGLTKPDEAFYRHVLGATGWKAEDVLFVDDLEENCAGAEALGFRALRFTGGRADLEAIAAWCGLEAVL